MSSSRLSPPLISFPLTATAPHTHLRKEGNWLHMPLPLLGKDRLSHLFPHASLSCEYTLHRTPAARTHASLVCSPFSFCAHHHIYESLSSHCTCLTLTHTPRTAPLAPHIWKKNIFLRQEGTSAWRKEINHARTLSSPLFAFLPLHLFFLSLPLSPAARTAPSGHCLCLSLSLHLPLPPSCLLFSFCAYLVSHSWRSFSFYMHLFSFCISFSSDHIKSHLLFFIFHLSLVWGIWGLTPSPSHISPPHHTLTSWTLKNGSLPHQRYEEGTDFYWPKTRVALEPTIRFAAHGNLQAKLQTCFLLAGNTTSWLLEWGFATTINIPLLFWGILFGVRERQIASTTGLPAFGVPAASSAAIYFNWRAS